MSPPAPPAPVAPLATPSAPQDASPSVVEREFGRERRSSEDRARWPLGTAWSASGHSCGAGTRPRAQRTAEREGIASDLSLSPTRRPQRDHAAARTWSRGRRRRSARTAWVWPLPARPDPIRDDQKDAPDDQAARRSVPPAEGRSTPFSSQVRPWPVEIDSDAEHQGRRPEVDGIELQRLASIIGAQGIDRDDDVGSSTCAITFSRGLATSADSCEGSRPVQLVGDYLHGPLMEACRTRGRRRPPAPPGVSAHTSGRSRRGSACGSAARGVPVGAVRRPDADERGCTDASCCGYCLLHARKPKTPLIERRLIVLGLLTNQDLGSTAFSSLNSRGGFGKGEAGVRGRSSRRAAAAMRADDARPRTRTSAHPSRTHARDSTRGQARDRATACSASREGQRPESPAIKPDPSTSPRPDWAESPPGRVPFVVRGRAHPRDAHARGSAGAFPDAFPSLVVVAKRAVIPRGRGPRAGARGAA